MFGGEMKRTRFYTMRLNEVERQEVAALADLWGCRVTEVFRLCFRMIMLGEKPKLAEESRTRSGKPTAGQMSL